MFVLGVNIFKHQQLNIKIKVQFVTVWENFAFNSMEVLIILCPLCFCFLRHCFQYIISKLDSNTLQIQTWNSYSPTWSQILFKNLTHFDVYELQKIRHILVEIKPMNLFWLFQCSPQVLERLTHPREKYQVPWAVLWWGEMSQKSA